VTIGGSSWRERRSYGRHRRATCQPHADVQHLYNDQTGRRRSSFEVYIVAYPVDRDECKLGEELFDRMCKSHFYNGLGFNIQTGGLSNVAPINGLQKRYVSVIPLTLCGLSLPADPRLFSVYLTIC
jgi:hypothetical protein